MSVKPLQKSKELLEECRSPLIFLPPFPSADALASAYALAVYFQEKSTPVKIICDDTGRNREVLSFIETSPVIENKLSGARDFVIIFNTKYNAVSSVRTEKDPEELRIFVTPEKASIDPRDFSFQPSTFVHDLVITIGATDKEQLGKCYETNPDIFYEVPIINIDSSSANELYGQINVVDITASTLSELVAEILSVEEDDTYSPVLYECLLAGIIAGTHSFQQPDTRPKAFRLASLLMDRGADQQKIVRALYKTQPLHLLKLWGKTLANIKWNEKLGLIWGAVTLEDFVQSRATAKDLPLVLEKIKESYTTAKIYMLMHQENATSVKVLLSGATESLTETLLGILEESERHGDHLVLTLTKDSLEAAEESLLEKLTL